MPVQILSHLCRSIPACPAISNPDPYFSGQPSASRAPLLSHHPQSLPSYSVVFPTPKTCVLPSAPTTLPKTFLQAPLLSYPIRYLPHPPTPVTSGFSSNFKVLPKECHGPLGPRGAQLHNGVLQQRLDVVLLHIELAFPETPLFLSGCHTARRHGSLGEKAHACCVSYKAQIQVWPVTYFCV